MLDTESAFIADESITPEVIGKFKTASYSFVGPLTTGALLGGASEADLRSIEKFAESLGIAYQLRDDLLGVFGDEKATGKSATSDITEGKHTLLIEQFEIAANPIQKAAFYKAFHNPIATAAEIETARTMLVESGAKASVENRIEQLGTEADALIESLEIPDEYKKAFHQLVDDCLKRAS